MAWQTTYIARHRRPWPDAFRYNSAMPDKYKEIFNLALATIIGTITGLSLNNLGLGALTGIIIGVVFSIFNRPKS